MDNILRRITKKIVSKSFPELADLPFESVVKLYLNSERCKQNQIPLIF